MATLAQELSFDESHITLANELVSKHLPPLINPDVFAFLFGISKQYMYYLGNSENHYNIYEIEKPNGGKRQIEAPRRYLKLVQRWINSNILNTYQFPSFITGFVPGKNIFSNAQPHLKNKNLMVLDIKNYFPSVKSGKVYKIFRSFGYSRKVSNLLTYLCTYRSRLPQGAPTSPSLANMAFLPVDLELMDLAKGWECDYTRYADDIAFSGNTPFSNDERYKAKQIIENAGFFINEDKTRIIGGTVKGIV